MPPNDGSDSVKVDVRSFSYEFGAVGPVFQRPIAVEAPIEIVVGSAPFAVMMATPRDLEDFVCGFLLTEGLVDGLGDIRSLEIAETGESWRINATLTGEKLKAHLARSRAIQGRTGCGLCGIDDLSHLPSPRHPVSGQPPIDPSAIGAAVAELDKRQPLNALTRAAHAAAWCARDGRIVLVREDVGRHNALDKAIGALMRDGVSPDSGFFVITSRCSFEMVAKAAIFGVSALVSISAPTSLALERAREYGVWLIAVARGDMALCFGSDLGEQSKGLAA